MTTHRLIHGAVIHAGTAADATQHLSIFASDEIGSAVIDEDEIHMLRAIALTRAFSAREHGKIVGDRLTRG